MPIYMFKCDSCGDEYEDFRNIAETEEKRSCISCGKDAIRRIEVVIEDCCGCPVSVPIGGDWRKSGTGCEC